MPDHHDTFTHTNPEIDVHSMGEVHEHPTWKQYKWVAIILTVITVLEVWAYYIPSFVASPAFVPILLIMSALKFAIATLISLLFLFGKFAGRLPNDVDGDRAAAHGRESERYELHGPPEHGCRHHRVGGGIRVGTTAHPSVRARRFVLYRPGDDVLRAQWLAPRSERLVFVQRTHGAAPAARAGRRAAARHGRLGGDATTGDRRARHRTDRALDHLADPQLRDLQRRRRGVALAAALQL